MSAQIPVSPVLVVERSSRLERQGWPDPNLFPVAPSLDVPGVG